MTKIEIHICYLNSEKNIEPIDKVYVFDDEIKTYSQLLKKLNINEYTVLIFNNKDEALPLDSTIDYYDLKILKITFD